MGQSSNWPIDLSYEHVAPFPGPSFSPIPAQHRTASAVELFYSNNKAQLVFPFYYTIMVHACTCMVASAAAGMVPSYTKKILLPYMIFVFFGQVGVSDNP
jgi:hypothetical protein